MNNEPAFPRPHSQPPHYAQEGMTLRDYFAAKAMQAILTDGSWYGHTSKTAANQSYEMADEMLIARKAK
jgi:hypothetical protein